MSSSALPPLSLLAKGIGQTVSNGHEKLEVYLEPKDYYNLKSGSFGKIASLQQRRNEQFRFKEVELKPANIHKTFVTRKGALLIFSEELANKAFKEEAKALYSKHPAKVPDKSELRLVGNKYQEEQNEEDPLRTVHDLRVAILMYGSQPEYRKKGDDLYLRFVHNARASHDERFMRPGFSPHRYMSAWSRLWHQEMLKKMQEHGLVQSTSLHHKDPLLPQFYHHDWYNLSKVPPPYRVTQNMLHAWDGSSYEYQRMRRSKAISDIKFDDEVASKGDAGRRRKYEEQTEAIPIQSIQAVRFLESGEVKEVKYSELKQHEKQEILAELLATAWEHGKHIEQMLDLVLSSNKPRSGSAASSDADSELMMDMHKAILSLAESPVQRQLRAKQAQLEKEKQAKMKAKEEKMKREKKHRQRADHGREKQEQREKRKNELNIEAQNAIVSEKPGVPLERQVSRESAEEREQRRAARAARHQERERVRKEKEKERELRKERELEKEKERERRRKERHLEREKRAAAKREAQKQALERAQQEEMHRTIQPVEDNVGDYGQHIQASVNDVAPVEVDPKMEKRRARRKEKEQQYIEDDFERQQQDTHREKRRDKRTHDITTSQLQPPIVHVEKRETKHMKVVQSHDDPLLVANGNEELIYDERVGDYVDRDSHKTLSTADSDNALPSQSKGYTPKSRPMPNVPQNTPATEQRKTRVQRQLPLENVIYEAKSKRSHASSSTSSSLKSSKKATAVYHTPTVVSSGDGQFATYIEPKRHASKVKITKKEQLSQPVNLMQELVVHEKAPSHVSSQKSSLVFSVALPNQSLPSIGKSSFYGGAMPISSNIVKQTLSDKISILSASQDYSATSDHVYEVSSSVRNGKVQPEDDQLNVPGAGYEGSSITQQSTSTTKKSSQTVTISSQTTSEVKRKPKAIDFSESEDEQMDSSSQLTYSILKGAKGPGSQSSAAYSKGESKKSTVMSRGSLPQELLGQKHAAIYMPDKKIVDVRALPPQSSNDDDSSLTAKEEKISSDTEQQKSTKSSQTVSTVSERQTKPDTKVTFEQPLTEESEEESGDETETGESEKSEAGWPPVDKRPISSRSAKLTDHAQKVAEIVVSHQRPDSKLEEDAARAAELWNKINKEEQSSTGDSESYETSVDEDAQSSQWNAADIVETVDKNSVKSSVKKGSGATRKSKASSKESVAASVKSSTTGSSRKTSASSVQEAFIKEVKRKASELGIDEKELQFEANLVNKVVTSTVDPNEVEVFHDLEEGKHVVRSRHSSITTKSQHTDASSETKRRQFVVDVPKEDKNADRPNTASTESSTVSAVSSRLRKLSQSSSTHSRLTKSSIPVSGEDVALNYDVTSYEKKPPPETKHEAPLVVTNDRKIEPEKLDRIKTDKKASKPPQPKEDGKKKTSSVSSTDKEKVSQVKESTPSKPDNAKVKALKSEEEKSLDSKSMKKMRVKKGKDKQQKEVDEKEPVSAPVASPAKQKVKSPETPFHAGRAKDAKVPKGLQSPPQPTTPSKPKKSKKDSSHKEAKLKTTKPKVEKEPEVVRKSASPQVVEEKKTKTPLPPEPVPEKTVSPVASYVDEDPLPSIPSESPEDDYDFVRVEESPAPSEPEVIPEPVIEQVAEDAKSLASEKTATEATAETDNSEELLRAAEEEEARLARKKEKDGKRLAAAEKRRLEVERRRKEKEEQQKREKEEQERQDAMKEELEREQQRRMDEMKKRREEAEQARLREQEEEELRKQREEQRLEREKRMQEEHKRKIEELQRRKREEEMRKAEEARLKAEEEREALEREKEMLAQMAEEEVLEYERKKREEMEERKRLAEERRLFEEEQARIMMEQARMQAIIKAKQQAALEEKLKFIRSFQIEANGLEKTQQMSRAFQFSYFELLELLGLTFNDVDLDLD